MNYHDALAKLGVGIAHPGGFATTKQWVKQIPWGSVREAVEIGCGTGRTACYLASLYNIQITGFDSRLLMIEKASIRANKLRLNHKVKFSVADAHKIPLQTHSVDLVYLESVSVFVQPELLFTEIYRILRPGGKIVDVEMTSLPSLPKDLLEEIKKFYGARQVPTMENWRNLLEQAGFLDAKNLWTADVDPKQAGKMSEEFDQDQIITLQPQEIPEITRILLTNSKLLVKTAPYLQYTVLSAMTPITQK